MAENSLFAILLRKPWWFSIGLAVLFALIALAALPQQYKLYGTSSGFPFLVIGIIAAWKQLRLPSRARVDARLAEVRAMSWRDFSGTVEEAFRRQGYAVTRLDSPAADFELTNPAGRRALVSCKRWKAASNGVEPLRELHAATEAREAQEGIYLTAGVVTDNARRFAADKRMRVLEEEQLAQLLLWKGRAKA
jgi:restriction system protein